MSDIAVRAGVSQTTVSFVLNGRSGQVKIAEETRLRVLDTAREMGYRTNELARAMATGKSRLVGILSVGNAGENTFRNMTGALQEAALNGYSTKVLVMPWLATLEEIHNTICRCSEWRLDGVVAINLRPEMLNRLQEEMQNHHVPVVYIEATPEKETAPVLINTDELLGMRLLFQHLFELGHRRIAFATGAQSGMSARRAGFFQEIQAEFGLPVRESNVAYSAWERRDIIEPAINQLMEQTEPPTALMCASDSIAMIAIHTLRLRGMNVPGDVSVTGFGDFSMAKFASPPLTTLNQYFDEIGERSMKQLLAQIESGQRPTKTLCDLMPPSLVLRESTSPPP